MTKLKFKKFKNLEVKIFKSSSKSIFFWTFVKILFIVLFFSYISKCQNVYYHGNKKDYKKKKKKLVKDIKTFLKKRKKKRRWKK